jgi:cyanophycinase-like exopeptidase
MLDAWEAGAALAGSSAGAMALCEKTLVMARWPHHTERRAVPALGLVPGTAVIPHYERFGPRWKADDLSSSIAVLGIDERTAALWDGAGWQARGEGGVTVVRGSEQLRFAAGETCAGIPAPDPGRARAQPPVRRSGSSGSQNRATQ